MQKGCQRNVYHIQKTDSDIFDEVYFVLNKRVSAAYTPGLRHINEREMADEAERIIRDMCKSCQGASAPPFGAMGKAGAFALGAVSSSALIGTAALLLVLL